MKPLAVLAAVVFVAHGAYAADAAKLFNENCTACHSIGGGDGAGPDLIKATQMPREGIRQAIVRMQDNVGPLQPAQIDALVDYLKSKAPAAVVVQMTPEQKLANANAGRALFFGETPLANRGTPCFACHSVAGRGGNLAVDLTATYAKRGDASIVATAQQPSVPLMKAAYGAHPVTAQEAWHLAAFLKEGGVARPHTEVGVVHGTAAGIAFVVLAGIAVIVRPRRRR